MRSSLWTNIWLGAQCFINTIFTLNFILLCLVLLASHFLCVFEHGLILFSLGTQYHQVPHHQNHRELKNQEVEIVMCHKTQQIVQVVSELVRLFPTLKVCRRVGYCKIQVKMDF